MTQICTRKNIYSHLKIVNFIIIMLIIVFLSNFKIGYELSIGDIYVGNIHNKKIIDEYYDKKIHKTIGQGNELTIDKINLKLQFVHKDNFLNEEDVKYIFDNKFNIYVNSYALKIDGIHIANVLNTTTDYLLTEKDICLDEKQSNIEESYRLLARNVNGLTFEQKEKFLKMFF